MRGICWNVSCRTATCRRFLLADNLLVFFETLGDLDTVWYGDAEFHVDSLLAVAILYDDEAPALEGTHCLWRQPQYIFFTL